MGGTIAKLASEGHRVVLVDMTNGEPTPHGSIEIRAREAAAAARILGVERVQMGLPNRALTHDLPSRHAVAALIRELRAEILFAPHPVDAHPDHVAAASIIRDARFDARLVKSDIRGEPIHPRRLFHYYAVHLRSVPAPSFVLDTSGHAATKRRAILAYESQFVMNPTNTSIPDWLDASGTYFGSRIGTASGEPFYCEEVLSPRDFTALC